MPSAIEVSPAKWSSKTILFDDGIYSVISGFSVVVQFELHHYRIFCNIRIL
jgi:hypothetical protein